MTATAPLSPLGPAQELRKARKDKGLDQDELAELVGVSEKTISRWENGHGEPTISQWRAIARVTGAAWLLGGGVTFVTKDDDRYNRFSVLIRDQLRLFDDLTPARNVPELSVVP